jgi:hypothetical protein
MTNKLEFVLNKIKELKWQVKYLFYRYVLRHTYSIGLDIAAKDSEHSCMVVARTNHKGQVFIEKIIN